MLATMLNWVALTYGLFATAVEPVLEHSDVQIAVGAEVVSADEASAGLIPAFIVAAIGALMAALPGSSPRLPTHPRDDREIDERVEEIAPDGLPGF